MNLKLVGCDPDCH